MQSIQHIQHESLKFQLENTPDIIQNSLVTKKENIHATSHQ